MEPSAFTKGEKSHSPLTIQMSFREAWVCFSPPAYVTLDETFSVRVNCFAPYFPSSFLAIWLNVLLLSLLFIFLWMYSLGNCKKKK